MFVDIQSGKEGPLKVKSFFESAQKDPFRYSSGIKVYFNENKRFSRIQNRLNDSNSKEDWESISRAKRKASLALSRRTDNFMAKKT